MSVHPPLKQNRRTCYWKSHFQSQGYEQEGLHIKLNFLIHGVCHCYQLRERKYFLHLTHTVNLCASCSFQNKQILFPFELLTRWSVWRDTGKTAPCIRRLVAGLLLRKTNFRLELSIWDLWRTKFHLCRSFSQRLRFSPVSIIPPTRHTRSSTCH